MVNRLNAFQLLYSQRRGCTVKLCAVPVERNRNHKIGTNKIATVGPILTEVQVRDITHTGPPKDD